MVSQLRFVVHEEEIDRCILSVAGDGKNRGVGEIAVKARQVEFCKKNMARILPDLTKIFLGGTEKNTRNTENR